MGRGQRGAAGGLGGPGLRGGGVCQGRRGVVLSRWVPRSSAVASLVPGAAGGEGARPLLTAPHRRHGRLVLGGLRGRVHPHRLADPDRGGVQGEEAINLSVWRPIREGELRGCGSGRGPREPRGKRALRARVGLRHRGWEGALSPSPPPRAAVVRSAAGALCHRVGTATPLPTRVLAPALACFPLAGAGPPALEATRVGELPQCFQRRDRLLGSALAGRNPPAQAPGWEGGGF